MSENESRDPPEYELIKNCILPRNLVYNVEEDVWARDDDGVVTFGRTDSSQTITGSILHVNFLKEEGEQVAEGKPLATIEAAKWMGAVRTPVAGEVVALNDEVEESPDGVHLINRSPYHRGWIAKIRPDDSVEDALSSFLSVDEAIEAYEEKMDRLDLDACVHCDEFEI